MTGPCGDPAALPSPAAVSAALRQPCEWSERFRSMACDVTVTICDDPDPVLGFARVKDVFAHVERECTRFDAASDLMRANAIGGRCVVGDFCFAALLAAHAAYVETAGMFDPRVLTDLVALGYDRSLPFETGTVQTDASAALRSTPLGQWHLRHDMRAHEVEIGPHAVDLGGIGKGLALRWAAGALSDDVSTFAIDAGGDCYLAGPGPHGSGWHVGIEDPSGGAEPVAVLSVVDAGCATSSIRVRRWTSGARTVHHIIDPRTGEPGGEGLRSVTVVGPDPAMAEVWSKVLFLHGRDGVADAADARGLAAAWVSDDGALGVSDAMRDFVIWQRA